MLAGQPHNTEKADAVVMAMEGLQSLIKKKKKLEENAFPLVEL